MEDHVEEWGPDQQLGGSAPSERGAAERREELRLGESTVVMSLCALVVSAALLIRIAECAKLKHTPYGLFYELIELSFGGAPNGYQHARHAVGETLVEVEADWVIQRARREM